MSDDIHAMQPQGWFISVDLMAFILFVLPLNTTTFKSCSAKPVNPASLSLEAKMFLSYSQKGMSLQRHRVWIVRPPICVINRLTASWNGLRIDKTSPFMNSIIISVPNLTKIWELCDFRPQWPFALISVPMKTFNACLNLKSYGFAAV